MSGRSPPSPASQADALVSEIREQVALERRRLLDDDRWIEQGAVGESATE